jgi:hypothetical protein
MSAAVIERSTGTPIGGGLVAGGGYRGCSAELDAVVCEAASALAEAYGADIEIRFNSDRESGGAWLKTADGNNARTGICAALVTASARARWGHDASLAEAEARTGRASWQREPLTARQRKGARQVAAGWRKMLAENPEGQLTVFAFIDAVAAGDRWRELARLSGWNDPAGRSTGYHYGEARTVTSALGRCLRFAPSQQELAELARWEGEGGAS